MQTKYGNFVDVDPIQRGSSTTVRPRIYRVKNHMIDCGFDPIEFMPLH